MNNIQAINATKARNNFFSLLEKAFLEKQTYLIKKGKIPLVYMIPVNIVDDSGQRELKLLTQINKLRESMKITSDSVSLLKEMRQNA